MGSSLFLRARFGNGYYLTIVKDEGDEGDDVSIKVLEFTINKPKI